MQKKSSIYIGIHRLGALERERVCVCVSVWFCVYVWLHVTQTILFLNQNQIVYRKLYAIINISVFSENAVLSSFQFQEGLV